MLLAATTIFARYCGRDFGGRLLCAQLSEAHPERQARLLRKTLHTTAPVTEFELVLTRLNFGVKRV